MIKTYYLVYDMDADNYCIVFDAVNLNNATNSMISNIYASVSRINFVKLENVVGLTSVPIYLNFTNATFRDWETAFKESLFTFSNIISQEELYITLDQLTFANMTFAQGGNCMSFGHQMITQILLNNVVFTGIDSGSIYLKSYYQNVSFETKVLIVNGVFEKINSNAESVFILDEGANLEIRDTAFNQISCKEIGGIINAGYQNTRTNIYNSSFTNNTSIAAALFLIESGSSIILHNWRIFQNFAITAGLIEVNSDGYFEMYNSTVFQNYGMTNTFAEIVSSSAFSIVDNCIIYKTELVIIDN